MQKTLVVLAAGIGSRYGGLKQMDPVGPSGEFILDYSVYDAVRAGFTKVVFVISRSIEDAFKETLGGRLSQHVEVEYAIQELTDLPHGFQVSAQRKKPWGTGHAVWSARHVVDGPFAVINADDFYGRHAYTVLAAFLTSTADDPASHAMVGYLLHKTVTDHGSVARGICKDDGAGHLVEIVERTRIEKCPEGIRFADEEGRWQALTGNEIASMNLWGFKTSFFAALEREFAEFVEEHGDSPSLEFFAPTVANNLILEGRGTIDILRTSSEWLGVTYAQDKPRIVQSIQEMVDAGVYPESLWDK